MLIICIEFYPVTLSMRKVYYWVYYCHKLLSVFSSLLIVLLSSSCLVQTPCFAKTSRFKILCWIYIIRIKCPIFPELCKALFAYCPHSLSWSLPGWSSDWIGRIHHQTLCTCWVFHWEQSSRHICSTFSYFSEGSIFKKEHMVGVAFHCHSEEQCAFCLMSYMSLCL